jgi:O-antigen/teichoic acid export membrane protein
LSSREGGAASRVALNSFWYGFDSLLGILMAVGISIPMARILGPERLGYFNFIMWLTAMSGGLACLGIPQATGKYMAEYLGAGNRGMARAIYQRSLWIQGAMAAIVSSIALTVLYTVGDPRYHLVSTLQILSTIPAMMVQVPTQANLANETMRTNIPGSIASNILMILGVPLSLFFHWDLLGVAATFLVARTADVLIRARSTAAWINQTPPETIPHELSVRMRSFGLKMTYISLIAMVIWDKSDLFFLKILTKDIRQISFFTVAFNLVEKVILAPGVFGSALSASLLAQYGRDSSKTAAMATDATRYLYLFSMPMLFGLSLMAAPLIQVLYGSKFLPAIYVLQVAGVLAILKPVSFAADSIFRATGRQGQMVFWTTICAFLNVLLDYLLIPRYGAVGAAIASGVAVSSQVIICMFIQMVSFQVPIDFKGLGKITLAGLSMAVPVVLANHFLPPLAAVIVDPISGAATFLLVLKLIGALHGADVERLGRLASVFPAALRPLVHRTVGFLGTPAALHSAT